jgi:hypothetical protein
LSVNIHTTIKVFLDFTTTAALRDKIIELWTDKQYCDQNVVKSNVAFGVIKQSQSVGDEQSYSLEKSSASFENSFKHRSPMIINDKKSAELFADHVISQLGELIEKRNKDTKTKIVCVYSILINFYHVLLVGKPVYEIGMSWNECLAKHFPDVLRRLAGSF